MRAHWMIGLAVAAWLASGCGQQAEDSEPVAADDPEPVQPVEVSAEEADEEQAGQEEELRTLRARVAELETQLSQCQTAQNTPSGTEVTPVPENVDVPSGQQATNTTNTTPDAGTRRRREDRSILGTILGTDDRNTRRRNNETITIPLP
jgi:hypothetical protein